MSKNVLFSMQSPIQHGDTPQKGDTVLSHQTARKAVNTDLQKSIQLLDEAVAPSVIRSSRTPRGGPRGSSYTSSRLESRSHVEPDLHPSTPSRGSLFSPVVQSPRRDATGYLSQSRPNLFQEDMTQVEMTEEITLTNMTFIATEDPGQKVSSGLFDQFMEVMKSHPAPHQVMDLLSGFEKSCVDHVNTLKKLCKGVTRNLPKLDRTTSTLDMLRLEKETWQLIRSLYKDRLETESKDDDMDSMEDHDSTWSLSEQNIASRLFEKDSIVRHSQLVIDWLETCASDNLDTFAESAQFFVDQPVSWENTLHQLQKIKQGVRGKPDRPMVSELDPDAPHRQRRQLDDLDREDERFLLQHLFMCLRAGQLDKAQKLCASCGQPWRAASLEGWRLLHDPNYDSLGAQEGVHLAPVEGNPFRDIWKAVCWRLCAQSDFDKYERAVYAALSGNLQAILPVCNSWMDYLWAYYRVMVDIRVEQEVRLLHQTERTLDTLPDQFWDRLLDPAEIFKEISASVNENVNKQAQNWYHIIQKYVILGDEAGLIEVMYSWLQSRSELPQHLLRLMTHIILFLRTVGRGTKEDLCEAIISAYVQSLIKSGQKSLVSHYVATLSHPAQVQWYATFLEGITDQEERQQCLTWAQEEDLDVAAITKTVVERVRAREGITIPPEHSLAPDLTVTDEDKAKIDALSWLVFEPSHRPEAVKQANAIMRQFIAIRKHSAAREAFEKLPSDTIEVMYHLWHSKTGSDELPPEDANAIREFMCIRAYLDAVESFNDWFSLYHNGQPVKPSSGSGDAMSFTDRVAMEHKMSQYQLEYDRWRHSLLQQTQATKDRIYNVLLFADGGWLVDTVEDPDADETRQHQMSQLRKLHLPALFLNLHNVLHSSQMYAQAVQIADVLASEQYQLYQEFSPEALQHFLSQIARSSRQLLDENKDPLGYELV